MHTEYDAIVIGAGLGGLSAGACFANEGKKVLVLERHDKIGGCSSVYRRKHLNIEVGLHLLDGLDSNDLKARLWKKLNLDKRIKTVPLPEFYCVKRAGDKELFVMPDSFQEARRVVIEKFPSERKSIEKYFELLGIIRNGLNSLVEPPWKSFSWWRDMPKNVYTLFRYNNYSVSEFFQELFGDNEELKNILGATMGFYGKNPDTISAILFASGQGSFYTGGGHYIYGGSQALANALKEVILENGGSVLCRREVADLLVDNRGKITGVRHEKRQPIGRKNKPKNIDPHTDFATVIFANAAPSVISEMLPDQYQRRFLKNYSKRSLSTSVWTLFIGLDRNPEEFIGKSIYTTTVFPEHINKAKDAVNVDCLMADEPNGKMVPYLLTNYSAIDSGLNNEGRHLLTACGLDNIENWRHLSEDEYARRKVVWQKAIIDDLEKHFPGISKAIVFKEMGTAKTMADYLNTPDGAVYGFNPEPPFITRALTSRTPIKNLYIASAFGACGGGFTGALTSGEHAAKEALKDVTKV